MKNLIMIFAVFFAFVFIACNEDPGVELPEGYKMGIIKEVEDAGRYTYLKVDENGEEKWLSTYFMEAKAGDTVYYSKADEMKNFKSESLGKTFPSLWMVQDLTTELPTKMGENQDFDHPEVQIDKAQELNIDPAEGGKTIAQIFEQKGDLNGKEVKVRGVVTKVNNNIMNRNWLHLQDGTSSNTNFDLVVTSDKTAQVGDTVTVSGKLATDKDFGSGYKYDVIVEEAQVEGGTATADGQAI